MKIYKDTFFTLLVKIPVAFLTFLYSVFLTRLLGPEGNGAYSFISINVYFLVLILGFNIKGSTTFFTANQKIPFGKILALATITLLLSVFLFILVAVGFYQAEDTFWILLLLPDGYVELFYLGFMALFFTTEYFKRLVFSILRGMTNFFAFNSLDFLISIINTLVFGFGWYYAQNQLGGDYAIASVFSLIIGAQFAIFLLVLFFFFRYVPLQLDFNINLKSQLRPFAFYASQGYIQSYATFLIRRAGMWLLELLKGITSLGYYALATQATNFLQTLLLPLGQVMMPYLAKMKEEEGQDIFLIFSRVGFTLVFLGGMVVLLIADFIIPLVYGSAFKPAILPLKILVIANIFVLLQRLFFSYNLAYDRQKDNVMTEWIGLVLIVVFNLILIPKFGIVGAAFATLLAFIITCSFIIFRTFPWLNTSVWNIFILKKKDVLWLIQFLKKNDKK